MKAVFADSFYYLAIVNADDAAHEKAVRLSEGLRGSIVTTAWVLTEVADALAAPGQRSSFLALLDTLRSDPEVTILPPDEELFEAGIDRTHVGRTRSGLLRTAFRSGPWSTWGWMKR